MHRFKAFVKKEFYHIFRDWRTLIILIGMPVAQILLFGFAITNEIRDAKIAVLDLSKDEVTKRIINRISSSDYFKIEAYLDHNSQIEKIFKKGSVKEVIVLEKNFAKNLIKESSARIQIISDATDPNTATLLLNYTRAIVAGQQLELNKSIAIPFQIEVEQKMLYNPELKGVYLFVPGLIAVILMLVSAMMTSISITKEKEMGTMEILLTTPMNPAQIIIAKVIPYLMLSFVNAVLVLLLGYFIFGVPIHGNLILLAMESILFTITALSLGIFISTKTSSQQVALMISLVLLMLPTMLLSGFIFPVENMPWLLRVISNVVPAKWFLIIIKSIMLKGSGIGMLWKETFILIGFIFLFIGLSVKNYKVRLS
jgi:ABC-2 type transport system permease protein